MEIAVTGATGFIGRQLCGVLEEGGHRVRAFGREPPLRDLEKWRAALRGADAVIHLAGRAHVTKETAADPAAEFRKVNLEGATRTAQAAAEAGVRRFVFVSTIGVLGLDSGRDMFSEGSAPNPVGPYAESKYEAELALREIERSHGLEVVIVRPPLVYGPNVKGNFLRLLKMLESGIPLPFGAIANRRSFVGAWNLGELLSLCATRPVAEHRLFLASDCHLSTPELLEMMLTFMGRTHRIFSVPTPMLKAAALIAGKGAEFQSFTGSLLVDSTLARSVLGWAPSRTIERGVGEMVDWFVKGRS